MDGEKLNRWLTLAANFGVLAGLVLLLVELDQTSAIERAQTRNDLSNTVIELLFAQATNPKLAEVIVKSNNFEPLTPEEEVMYVSRSEAAFRYWENVHYQHRQGMYDEIEFKRHLHTMDFVINVSGGLQRYWCDGGRDLFSEPFAVDIDRFIPRRKCANLD